MRIQFLLYGSAPVVAASEFILKPENTTAPGNNHKWELESIK
ncbi:hypothetical protein P2R17_11075 [Bacillus sp. Cr_R3]|nr:hypothetical protein [Bacillus sp. Cr_R3]